MNASQLKEILRSHPWSTSGELQKLAAPSVSVGVADANIFVKSLLRELVAGGETQQTGQKRGTRYALRDAPSFEPVHITPDLQARVLEAVNSGLSKSAQVAENLGVAVELVRVTLAELLSLGKISATGNKRSRQYWPAGQAPVILAPVAKTISSDAGVTKLAPPRQAPSSKLERKAPSTAPVAKAPRTRAPEIDESLESEVRGAPNLGLDSADPCADPNAPKLSIEDAARAVLASLPRRAIVRGSEKHVYSIDELANMLSDRNRQFNRYHAGHAIVIALREGLTLMHRQQRYRDGWSLYFWRPSDDTDPAPDAREPM